jgi:hypothetical protein
MDFSSILSNLSGFPWWVAFVCVFVALMFKWQGGQNQSFMQMFELLSKDTNERNRDRNEATKAIVETSKNTADLVAKHSVQIENTQDENRQNAVAIKMVVESLKDVASTMQTIRTEHKEFISSVAAITEEVKEVKAMIIKHVEDPEAHK